MVIIDNTVLSNFALIYQPEALLHAFYEKVGTTEAVFQELSRGIALGRLPKHSWEWLELVQMTDAETLYFTRLQHHLGIGEASCLAVASQRQWKMATDDKDARQWAIRLHVPHTGTLGILGLLITQGQITLAEGDIWLNRMIKAGYRSPMLTLARLIEGN